MFYLIVLSDNYSKLDLVRRRGLCFFIRNLSGEITEEYQHRIENESKTDDLYEYLNYAMFFKNFDHIFIICNIFAEYH